MINYESEELFLEAVLLLPEDDELFELFPVFFRGAEEIMLQQLARIGSLLRVLVEAAADEVLENGRPLRVLELGRILGHDQVQDLLLRLTDVGRLSVGKLEGEDTEGPNIYLDVVRGLSSDEFGCHPAHSAHLTVSLGLLLSELGRVTEIGKFQITRLVDEDVI